VGGAYGHMNHPFDLDQIQSGADLVKFFHDVIESMGEQSHSLKLDGVNASIKLVKYGSMRQFAGDRGSNGEIDVTGITRDRVPERWTPDPKKKKERAEEEYYIKVRDGLISSDDVSVDEFVESHKAPPHGMIGAYEKVLDIFNNSIRLIRPELQQLGMWDNPSRFFNIEYVEVSEDKKKTNVLQYENSYIAIHNVAQFYEKKGTGRANKKGPGFTSIDRPGLPRPMVRDAVTGEEKPTSDKGTPVPVNQEVLNSLVKKMRPIALKYGFQMYASIPTQYKQGNDAATVKKEFEKVLNAPLTLCIDAEECPIQLRLKDWLARARNPKGVPGIWIRDKKQSVDPLNKDIYLWGIAQNKLVDLLDDRFFKISDDGTKELDATKATVRHPSYRSGPVPIYQPLVDGIVFWEAIKNLGNVVKNSLTSEEFGDVDNQEGVVVRDKRFGSATVSDPESGETFEMPLDVKVTGNFIVQGLDTEFGKAPLGEASNSDALASAAIDLLNDEEALESNAAPEDIEPAPGEKIAIFPGSFKPPHRGHLKVVQHLLDTHMAPDAKAIVVISNPEDNPDNWAPGYGGSLRELDAGTTISAPEAKAIWELMLSTNSSLNEKVRVIVSPDPSSYRFALKYISEDGPDAAPPNSKIYFGCGMKGRDVERLQKLKSREDVEVIPSPCPTDLKHSPKYIRTLVQNPEIIKNLSSTKSKTKMIDDFHAGDLRDLIGMIEKEEAALELVRDFFPEGMDVSKILSIIYQNEADVNTQEPVSLDENKKKLSMEFLYFLVEQALEEISGMGGGAVAGFGRPLGGSDDEDEDEKDKHLTELEYS